MMQTTTAILIVVLVSLVGTFALAAVGTLSGEQAVQFAGMAIAAFLGAVAGKTMPAKSDGTLSIRPPKGPKA